MKARRVGPTLAMGLSLLAAYLAFVIPQTSRGTLPVPATGVGADESHVQNTYHVDASSPDAADDDKHGTADAPFATVSYACRIASADKDRNVGAKVIVGSGVYREAVDILPPPSGVSETDAPLVIEAAEREQAVIDGADTEGWTPSTWKLGDGLWGHDWPFRRNPAEQAALTRALHAASAPPSASGAAYRRGDLLIVNGIPLQEVNRSADLAPGCFWCREPLPTSSRRGKTDLGSPDPAAKGDIIARPPAETPLDGAIIQVGTRDHALAIHGRRNVVVRGLLLQHAAAPADVGTTTAGLVLDGCSNVLVEDVLCQWNDGAGLVVHGSPGAPGAGVTLRRVHLLRNGGSGLAAWSLKNLLVEDGEASFNNFRGEWADWIDAGVPAGVKISSVHGSTWRRLRAVGNFCRGVWCAGDDADLTLEDGTIRQNFITGLFIENDPGPLLVRRCVVANTKMHPAIREDVARPAGVSVAASPDVTMESNIVAGNAVAQLGLWEPASKTVLRAERHVYHHNVFYGADAGESIFSLPSGEGSGKNDFGVYYGSLASSENGFWNPALADAFVMRLSVSKATAAGTASGPAGMNLENWRTFLQKHAGPGTGGSGTEPAAEAGSRWQDPLFTDPAEEDFRLREQSPVADWSLPSDEGASTP